MKIGIIKDCTHVLGEEQGYMPLPVRKETITDSVNGEGTPCWVTAWYPTHEEALALLRGCPILLHSLGEGQPPVMLSVGEYGDGREVAEPRPAPYGVTRSGRDLPTPAEATPDTGRRWLSGLDYATLERQLMDGLACGGNPREFAPPKA